MQAVLQAVALVHVRFPALAPVVAGLQIPVPSQVCADVSVEPEQTDGTHGVPPT